MHTNFWEEREMPRIDALIFDVDGVLVDANDTYLKVIQRTLGVFLGFPRGISGESCFSAFQYRTAKGHPSFNDDYDLAWFGLRALLDFRKNESSGDIPNSGIPEETWQNLLQECPSENTFSWIDRRFPGGPPREEVRALCEEIYFGEDYPSITGKNPRYPLQKGLWKEDAPLVNWHWNALPLPSAIYTGRPETELRLALQILGWKDFPRDRCITPDSGIAKPSPKGLEVLAEKMHSRHPAFFGDSQSDIQAFLSYGKGCFFAIGSLIPGISTCYPSLDKALESLEVFPKIP